MATEKGSSHPEDDKIAPLPDWIKNNKEHQEQRAEKFKKLPKRPSSPPVSAHFEKQQIKPTLEDQEELQKLREELMIEKKEDKEIEELAEEFKENFEQGKIAYIVNTKIPKGSNYRGYEEKYGDVEPYKEYFIKRDGKDGVKPSYGVSHSGWNWKRFGDILIVLSPIERSKKITETVVEERITFFGKKKEIEVQREVEKDVPMTLADFGIKNSADEALFSLEVQYGIDNSRFKREKRDIFNQISFCIPESFARKVSEKITENYEKLFGFLKAIEPELIDLNPPKEAEAGPSGLVFYDTSKEVKTDYQEKKPTKIVPR